MCRTITYFFLFNFRDGINQHKFFCAIKLSKSRIPFNCIITNHYNILICILIYKSIVLTSLFEHKSLIQNIYKKHQFLNNYEYKLYYKNCNNHSSYSNRNHNMLGKARCNVSTIFTKIYINGSIVINKLR